MRSFVTLGELRVLRVCVWFVTIACVLSAATSFAVQVDFQLTGSNSLLANAYIVGLGNAPMEAQDAGGTSVTTTYSGTITVDVDSLTNPTTISFISANAVAANSGSWLPEVGGGTVGDPDINGDADPGTMEPANYGFVFNMDLGAGPEILYIASRDTVLSIDTVVAGAKPITGGQFDPFNIVLSVPTGTFDANLSDPGLFGGDAVTASDPLVDEGVVPNCTDEAGTANRCTAMGSYAVAGNLATLTLPIDFLLGGGTPEINFTGTFVATYSLAAAQDGDYNNNGKVDAADYALWRDGGPLQNDPTPGVQPGDYDVWKANFGKPPGSASGSAVPEPASGFLALIGLAGLWVLRRKTAR